MRDYNRRDNFQYRQSIHTTDTINVDDQLYLTQTKQFQKIGMKCSCHAPSLAHSIPDPDQPVVYWCFLSGNLIVYATTVVWQQDKWKYSVDLYGLCTVWGICKIVWFGNIQLDPSDPHPQWLRDIRSTQPLKNTGKILNLLCIKIQMKISWHCFQSFRNWQSGTNSTLLETKLIHMFTHNFQSIRLDLSWIKINCLVFL